MSCRFLPSLFTLTGRMLELISFLCGNVPRVGCEGVVISADAERLIVWAPPPLYTLVWARMCIEVPATSHYTMSRESYYRNNFVRQLELRGLTSHSSEGLCQMVV